MKTGTMLAWALAMGVTATAYLCQPVSHSAPKKQQTVPLPSPGVIISPQGFFVTPCVGTRCAQGRLTIPRKSGYDYTGLRSALVKLRTRYAKNRALTVTGSSSTRWNTVAQTIAHARITRDGKPLFPVVFLALAGGL